MSNVRPTLNCPYCNTAGQKTAEYRRLITFKCPKCGHEWSTLKMPSKETKQKFIS
ncbi:Hypothetical protein LUCI_0811 [Lucifera butyrica]|uniref:Uncharacterized protein n=1 Tax=Lucifera butyrica TaxID=1351585 RepID=A0A498R2I2_9FIRM|nr:Hypothetical protein LUCI_0811 [Lucifera butyrica]